jgi:hypothetical protein
MRFPKTFLYGLLALALLVVTIAALRTQMEKKARFSVDALELFLKAYEKVYQKPIESLSDFPDFHLVSTFEGMFLESQKIKKVFMEGYLYDFERLDKVRFVISASPVGFWSGQKEFGITDKGILRVNSRKTDVAADNYDEVESWTEIPRSDRICSYQIPDYLKD